MLAPLSTLKCANLFSKIQLVSMGRTSTDISVAVIGILNNILSRYTQSKFCGSRWTSHKEKYFPVWKDSKKKIYRPLFTISLTSKWLNKTAMSYVKTMNFTYCEMNFIICLLTSSETYAIHWTVYCCCLSTKKHCFPEKKIKNFKSQNHKIYK